MVTCERCGKSFDESFDRDTFSIKHQYLNFGNFNALLCADCANEVIEDEIDGIYFETCEKCGKKFDYVIDAGRFLREHDSYLFSFWKNDILCFDCAELEF